MEHSKKDSCRALVLMNFKMEILILEDSKMDNFKVREFIRQNNLHLSRLLDYSVSLKQSIIRN